MDAATLVRKLHSGEPIFGTCIISTSPHFAVAAKNAGCDFVFIDTEHIPIDREKLSWMCRTYSAMGIPPIVRVPEPEPFRACSHLDGGACGMVFPYVETVEQAKALVGACKYKPIKGAQLRGVLDGSVELNAMLQTDIKAPNDRVAAIANIESLAAIANLDNILAVDGLDAVLVGPHDLSVSMGLPCQWGHHDFHAAIDTIITKARAKGLGAGVHYSFANSVQYQQHWLGLGANLIVHSSDMVAFSDAMRADLQTLRGTSVAKGVDSLVV